MLYFQPELQAEKEHQKRLRHIEAAWPYRSVIGKVCDWTRQECDRHDGCCHCDIAFDQVVIEDDDGETD